MSRSLSAWGRSLIWILVYVQIIGCSHATKRDINPLAPREPQIRRGMRILPLDYLASFLAIPGKFILWNRKFGNHNISKKTEEDIRQYLIDNELYDVKVRLNEFAPFDEGIRVLKNKDVGILYRLIGLPFSVMFASLGRLLGGSVVMSDYYDGISNTIHIFSDDTAIALHETGHSKDFAHKRWKGTAALVRGFTGMIGIPLYIWMEEAEATEDAIDYLISKGKKEEAIRAYKVLYPAYSTYIGASSGILGYFLSVVSGHWYGRFKARGLRSKFRYEEELRTFRQTGQKPQTEPDTDLY